MRISGPAAYELTRMFSFRFGNAATAIVAAFALVPGAAHADTAGPLMTGHIAAASLDLTPDMTFSNDFAPGFMSPEAPTGHLSAAAADDPFRYSNGVLARLEDLVNLHLGTSNSDAEQECLAAAVYFEARNEPLEGQLAVAQVVLNRTRSGRYPATICAVVTQPAQFSFIRAGRFPAADRNCDAWRTAVGIARVARDRLSPSVAPNVLWYHATYVAPAWGPRLNRVRQIGTHIFYS